MSLRSWWDSVRGGEAPEGRRPVEDVRFTVLDTELTGLDERRDDIVSIGALRMQGGLIHVGQSFAELVRPSAVLDGRTVVLDDAHHHDEAAPGERHFHDHDGSR